MRAIWKGSISFGLVDVPVKLYSATEEHDLALHQVHDADGGRIRYERHCEVCGEQVSYANIDRAYDDGSRTVVLTDEDLRSLPSERSREIEVVEFVPSDQLDPLLFDRGYYLEPDSRSNKAYVLLRRVLAEEEHTAIARFTLRQRTRLAAVRVVGDVLLVQTLRWSDEVRRPEFASLEDEPRISERELALARTVVEEMTTDFDPTEFHDDYQEELQALVEAKLEQGEAVDTAATFGEEEDDGEVGEVIDLMEALQRSVDQRRAGKGSAKETDSGEPAKKRATRSSSRTSVAKVSGTPSVATKAAPAKSSTKATAKSSTAKSSTKSSTAKSSTAKSSTKSSTAKSSTGSPASKPSARTAAKSGTAKSGTAKSGTAKSTTKSAAKPAAKSGTTKPTASKQSTTRARSTSRSRASSEERAARDSA